jgi:hypothetical protein
MYYYLYIFLVNKNIVNKMLFFITFCHSSGDLIRLLSFTHNFVPLSSSKRCWKNAVNYEKKYVRHFYCHILYKKNNFMLKLLLLLRLIVIIISYFCVYERYTIECMRKKKFILYSFIINDSIYNNFISVFFLRSLPIKRIKSFFLFC